MIKGLAPPLTDIWSRYSMKEDIEFCLANLPYQADIPRHTSMTAENIDDHQFSQGEDLAFYRLSFSPALDWDTFFPSDSAPAQQPADTLLRGYRKGDRKVPLFSVLLDGPMCQEYCLPTKGAGKCTFYCYPTHVVESMGHPDDSSKLLVRHIYLTLENNQLSESSDAAPQVEIQVAMDTFYLPHFEYGERYKGLPFFPLDIHLRSGTHAIPFEPLQIGQRVPFWFTQRGIVSGSSVGKYGAGYWVKRDAAAAGAAGDSALIASRMRQGRLQEVDVLLTYLHNFKQHTFYEQGYLVLRDLNPDFGVSPDGLAIDVTQTWSSFPARIAEHYAQVPGVDPMRIALEFKVSTVSVKFPDYYIPQMYWEMIALGAAKASLLRMQKRKNETKPSKCMCYTIYRDPKIEQRLLENVHRAYEEVHVKRTKTLEELADEPAFVEMRQRFDALAKETVGVNMELPDHIMFHYHEKRMQAREFIPIRPRPPPAVLKTTSTLSAADKKEEEEVFENDGDQLDAYISRHRRIKQRLAEKNIPGAVHLCVDQMNAYGKLIKTVYFSPSSSSLSAADEAAGKQ